MNKFQDKFVILVEIQEWISKITDPEELEHIVALMKIKHNKKLKETDMTLVLHLDQKVIIIMLYFEYL